MSRDGVLSRRGAGRSPAEGGTSRKPALDRSGAEHPAEFFAVATECFFEQPRTLRRRHPELYEVLRGYYGQDPAAWRPRPGAGTPAG